MSRTLRLLGVSIAVFALLAISAMSVFADSSGRPIFRASMAGLPAADVNQTLFGVQAGGLPWSIEDGTATITAGGGLHVEVEGLVLAAGPLAGTNPIPHGQAIVTCAGAPVAMSSVVAFSGAGDAEVDETVALPAHCLAPAVFFAGVPAPGVDRWFAVTGW